MERNSTDMRMTIETLEKLQAKMYRIKEDNERLKQFYKINEEQPSKYDGLKPKQPDELYKD